MALNSKGQLTIPADLRAKYGLHPGDEVEVIEVGGTLQIVRAEGAESRGQRLVRRLPPPGRTSRAWAPTRSWPCSVASSPAAIHPATLIDSCVLPDVITGDQQWADWSAEQIATAMDAGRVVINPLAYAEVSVGYQTIEDAALLVSTWLPSGKLDQACKWAGKPSSTRHEPPPAAAGSVSRPCQATCPSTAGLRASRI